jgi:hypothetical protein
LTTANIEQFKNFDRVNLTEIDTVNFSFHQVLAGSCKQLDSWLEQLMAVSETNDINVLFIKLNRKGKYVVVQSKLTWVTDHFMYYTSPTQGDWIVLEFDQFFKNNTEIFKVYSGTTDTKSNSTISISTQAQQLV